MAPVKEAEELIPRFKLERVLNHDQNGRRVTLLGNIDDKPAILILLRAGFPESEASIRAFHAALTDIKNVEANDIYRWYGARSGDVKDAPPDLKIDLIWPCTDKQIKKYTPQEIRMVTETPKVYEEHVRPYIKIMRDEGRLNWVFNILDGKSEQDAIILRENSTGEDGQDESFMLLPDMNWDRKTLTSLHLLATPYRRDIWSLRDLKKSHVNWLKDMREKVINATIKVYDKLDKDQIKLYIHYQPTHYHFHIHVVHVMAEATSTQAVGRALGLENVISQLESMAGQPGAGFADLTLTYYLGTASDLWTQVFLPLKECRLG